MIARKFYIMQSAVEPMQSELPCYTPLTNHATDVHTVPLVMASDYAALEAENARFQNAIIAQPAKHGEALEVVNVVGWLGGNGLNTEESMASGAPFPLMTVAQHNRILAAAPAHSAERQEQGEVQRLREALEHCLDVMKDPWKHGEGCISRAIYMADAALAAAQEVEK